MDSFIIYFSVLDVSGICFSRKWIYSFKECSQYYDEKLYYSIGALIFFVIGFSFMFNGSFKGLIRLPDFFISGDYSALGLILP